MLSLPFARFNLASDQFMSILPKRIIARSSIIGISLCRDAFLCGSFAPFKRIRLRVHFGGLSWSACGQSRSVNGLILIWLRSDLGGRGAREIEDKECWTLLSA